LLYIPNNGYIVIQRS